MNIFILSEKPSFAAKYHCDKHVPKMLVESVQMMGSALIRHGVQPEDMPITQGGTPLKGGYHNHPCTKWAGDNASNFWWLFRLAAELATEFKSRYGKKHFCEKHLEFWCDRKNRHVLETIPGRGRPMSSFAVCMPDEFKVYKNQAGRDWLDPVASYRNYYMNDKPFAEWSLSGRGKPFWYRRKTVQCS